MKYFHSIAILLFVTVGVSAQTKTDTTETKKKPTSFVPTGVRVGTDLIAIGMTRYVDSYKGWEVNADVDFSRYYLAVDVGSWSRDYDNGAEIYSNNGNYFRIGGDVNFLLKDPDRNMFFLGLRYGRSKFSESLQVNKIDSMWNNNPVNERYSNSNSNGSWFELTTGIRVKIWKVIWMGYTARLKFGLTTNEDGNLIPHDIPGYGRTDKNVAWGFNYQIFVRIPVRRQQ
ncbi:DUF6048 family protein [Pseudochryseolinea flava]|uniref:DUF6048 family protein n=1 Tax=Pseudochryseolinea flava TaxID=2059302 RepID=UPI0010580E8B|nr:DUF6048 family protein [Pseudochryseolinea flava]